MLHYTTLNHLNSSFCVVVSIAIMKKIVDESKLVSAIGMDAETCKCLLRKMHGLPCAHELAEYGRVNMPVPANWLTHWKKLDMSPSAPSDLEAVKDLEKCLVDESEIINQHFSKACYSKKLILLKRMRELIVPNTSSLMEPEVKIRKHNKHTSKVWSINSSITILVRDHGISTR